MSGTNQPQPNGSGDFKEYVNGGSDLTTFKTVAADYVQIIGNGTTVVMTEAGAAASPTYTRTLTTDSTEPALVIKCPIAQLVSTTATRVRMGYGTPPPIVGQVVAPVNLAGGANSVSGVLPAANVQDYSDSTTIYTTGFTAVSAAINPFNFQSTGLNITFPTVNAAINGQSLVLFNNGTGATAVLALLGSSAGNSVLSGLWPTSLKATRFTASLNLGGWVPGV